MERNEFFINFIGVCDTHDPARDAASHQGKVEAESVHLGSHLLRGGRHVCDADESGASEVSRNA